ncbi:cytochrome c oxidase subunit II transmembrane domain-containing protein [Qipengyuania thermophila]
MSFQDPVSRTMEHISRVHDSVIIIVVFILRVVTYSVISLYQRKR